MINRRKFISSIAVVPAVMATPSLALAPLKNSLSLTPEIVALEAKLRTFPAFDWGTHNELRHHYLPISERVSRQHADTILANSIMDGYILNTLSDWHLTDWHGSVDLGTGIAVLLANADRYSEFVHLRAATLIKAGDSFRQMNNASAAATMYGHVTSIVTFASAPALKTYQFIAHSRLTMA